MAFGHDPCVVCGGSGITPGMEHLPESRIAGNNDCDNCFGIGSVHPAYSNTEYYGSICAYRRDYSKPTKVKVLEPASTISYHCHTGCITASGTICTCRCNGVNHAAKENSHA